MVGRLLGVRTRAAKEVERNSEHVERHSVALELSCDPIQIARLEPCAIDDRSPDAAHDGVRLGRYAECPVSLSGFRLEYLAAVAKAQLISVGAVVVVNLQQF